jgi:Flp pilus assembly protein TadG
MTITTNNRWSLRRQDGQAAVEFALIVPIVIFLFVGIGQFGIAFHNYLGITDAARVGARAAAVKRTNDPCGSARTAIQGAVSAKQWGVISGRITCTRSGPNVGDQIFIEIKYPYSMGVPGFSGSGFKLSGDFTSVAKERME